MKILFTLLIVLMALLSLAAGFAKVMLVPQELAFLQGFGLSELLIRGFGGAQLLGGALLLVGKTRLYGAILVVVGLLISTVLIFINGDIIFGVASLVPVLLTAFIITKSVKFVAAES